MTNAESLLSARKRKLLIAVWVVTLFGLLVSVELTVIYYKSMRDVGYKPPICQLSEKIDCEKVALSKYSTIIGIPNSVYGMIMYAFILALIPFRLWTRFRIFERLENYLALLSIFSIGFTGYLASISTFVIKVFCPWCMTLYVLNVSFLVLMLVALDRPGEVVRQIIEDLKFVMGDPRIMGALIGAVVVAAILIVLQLNRLSGGNLPVIKGTKAPVEIDISHDPVLGPERAPVTIIEFSDFQCPFCKEMHFTLKKVRAKFGPRIRVVYKNFPLDAECNSSVKVSVHPDSCVLAYAGECAYLDGCFANFYEKLIETNVYSPGSLMQMAIDCGIEPNQFRECLSSPEAKQAVAKDIEDALKLGITGTPMLVINDRVFQGSLSDKEMEKVITAILEGKEIPKEK